MKIISLLSMMLLLVLTSCDTSTSDTLIAKNQLGLLDRSTRIDELNSILENDSIAEFDLESRNRTQEIEVFDSNSKVSLVIEPNYKNGSLVTISEIQILDSKYKTKKGLGIDGTFKTVYENYKISNIQNSINSIIINIEELGAYIVIDKKHLPSELRFDSELKIEANQIPDDAPFRYFWLRFEDSNQ